VGTLALDVAGLKRSFHGNLSAAWLCMPGVHFGLAAERGANSREQGISSQTNIKVYELEEVVVVVGRVPAC
jgi:hypothetical protein